MLYLLVRSSFDKSGPPSIISLVNNPMSVSNLIIGVISHHIHCSYPHSEGGNFRRYVHQGTETWGHLRILSVTTTYSILLLREVVIMLCFLSFFIFGCIGSLLLRAGFLQLWRAGATLCGGA